MLNFIISGKISVTYYHCQTGYGDLLTTIDARSNTYTRTYDLLNSKTSLKYPVNSVESYGYDAVGNLKTYVTRAGQTKTSTFDNRNREVSYAWSDGVTPNVSRTDRIGMSGHQFAKGPESSAGRLLRGCRNVAERALRSLQAKISLWTPVIEALELMKPKIDAAYPCLP